MTGDRESNTPWSKRDESGRRWTFSKRARRRRIRRWLRVDVQFEPSELVRLCEEPRAFFWE